MNLTLTFNNDRFRNWWSGKGHSLTGALGNLVAYTSDQVGHTSYEQVSTVVRTVTTTLLLNIFLIIKIQKFL